MRLLERLGIYARAPDGRAMSEIEDDIRDEIAHHIAMRTDALVASGVAIDVARKSAHHAFGDAERVYAACRETELGERLMLQRINFVLMIAALAALGCFAWRAETVGASTGAAFARLEGQLDALAGTVRDTRSTDVIEAQLAELSLRMTELRANGLTEAHPKVVALQRQIDALATAPSLDAFGDNALDPVAAGRTGALFPLAPVRERKSDGVFVMGKVERPGSVQWDKDLTLLMALSECGGASEFASLTNVRIVRDKKAPIEVDVARILETGKGDVELKKGDRIYVPEAFF